MFRNTGLTLRVAADDCPEAAADLSTVAIAAVFFVLVCFFFVE